MNLSELNSVQADAVQYVDSPVLIFAGAGSGKTRVLTHKIAYLIGEVGLSPSQILAVTFTNKAASEMASRVEALLRESGLVRGRGPAPRGALHPNGGAGVNIGTFHATCARILRKEIHRLDYTRDFVIYDRDDQLRLLKMVLEQNEYDLALYPPNAFDQRISWAKSHMLSPEQLAAQTNGTEADILVNVYRGYQLALKNNQALDFDDLLLLPLTLFDEHPEVLNRYRKLFHYILVDEYQDTNRPQFEFIRRLAQDHRRICVVGDDDQSIYTWRGADITNILNFSEVFKDAKVFKLEQNYRSTSVILTAASAIVERNKARVAKKLWTNREGGERIQIFAAADERAEADIIYQRIQHEVLVEKRRFRDMVILYRTNAQSRAIEDALRRRTMAYIIVGGVKFYDRKEVKDVMAYLRILVNSSDSVSLERIINFPPRAIGETSMNRLRVYAREKGLALFEALDCGLEAGVQLKQAQAMKAFKAFIEKYQALAGSPAEQGKSNGQPVSREYARPDNEGGESFGMGETVAAFIEEVGIIRHYREQEGMDAGERLDNIQELVRSIDQYQAENGAATLRDFLEEVALLTDIDRWNDDANAVTLMTLHSAKGLEFPVVFLTGLEEGLFPLQRSDERDVDEEEERRLFYVGLTRAMDKVYLSYALQRRRWGSSEVNGTLSRFVRELPQELVTWHSEQGGQPRTLGAPGAAGRSRPGIPLHPARQPSIESILDDFVVGTWVEHKLFGKGKIAEREGVGDNLKLTVEFSGGHRKKLVARYANLNRL
ncbi:MAG: UvrD-helicase domain-containing protein [Candidatus Marinimicrobia bacterium]|nr:UvrD-helicase domain-containing protein [Candidatus Neomarinimicrobiota bacterium]